MADDSSDDAESRAAGLVREASDEEFIALSKLQTRILVEAVERDIATLTKKVNGDEERLAKLETQTRVLSDAVVAITRTNETLTPAVRAVQDEMQEHRRATDAQPHLPGGRRATDQKP